LEIEWGPKGVFWYLNGELLHKIGSGPLVAKLSLPIAYENINDNGEDSDITFEIAAGATTRLGDISTQKNYVYQSGQTAGVVCKYGPGDLHGLVVSGVANNSDITLYDNTAASGTVMWNSGAMGAQTQPFSLDFGGIPFSDGLTLLIEDASSTVTVIYE
jgi:hypothetical protein